MELLETLRTGLAGRYEIERELGRGGMAIVYDALDRRHGRHVAIKVLRPEIAQAVGAERFLREIEIEAGLQHPHILPLYDSGQVDGVLFYVMPRVDGDSLRARLDREGQLRFEDAYRIADEVGDALSYAHAMGVVHRDIKPENILLSNGHALVTDFGIAAAVSAAGGERLTESGIAIGTPQYMSPEQAGADPRVDPRTDLYALGCVLYEMLAGQVPFSGSTAQAIMRRHQFEPPPPLDVVRPLTPSAVVDVITTALQKAPADRHRTVAEFREQLARAAREPGPASRHRRLAGWGARVRRLPLAGRIGLAVGVVGGAVALALVLGPSGPRWVGGRPASVVVVPFDTPSTTDAERRLVLDLAAALTRELDAWETIRVVPNVALAGPMFDLDLRGPTLTRVTDAVRLAGAFGVQAVVTIVARIRGDSADVEVDLFDRRTGHPVGRGFRASGPAADPPGLVAPLAVGLLGLSSVVDPRAAPRLLSADPQALIQDAGGVRALERWRLVEAERHFRAALALDSTFAVARHRLAQTLYWQAAQEPARLSGLGPEIARHSTAALRDAAGLPARDSLHIRAFHAFQSGDYGTARRLYRDLLGRDSADVYAWLLLGSVEYWDPWLARGPDGVWLPRASLDAAVRAFAEAVRLQPTFDLGYGHLFDIHQVLIRSIEMRGCPVFEPPTGEHIAPWEDVDPRQPEAFCPLPLDSLTWVPFDSLEPRAREAGLGADRLFEQSLRLVRRWTAYAPDEPKPWRELTAAVVQQRARLGPTSPARLDSLAADALTSLERALTVSRDTLPLDLVQLGVLHLGIHAPARAVFLTEAGLARYAATGDGPRAPLPAFAANVFLAVGRPGRALPLATAAGMTRFVPDSATGTLVPWGGAEPLIDRLRLLGAVQVGGEPVRVTLAEVARLWSAPRYTPAQQRILRRDAALRAILGLVLVPGATAAWDRGLEWDEPLWRALVALDTHPASAEAYLARSLQAPTPLLTDAARAYLQGLVAARLGRHAEAIALFSRIDSLPLGLDRLDFNWGLRWPAVLRRAESHEALGQWNAARDAYERFARAWADGDSLVTPLVASARRRAAAMRERG